MVGCCDHFHDVEGFNKLHRVEEQALRGLHEGKVSLGPLTGNFVGAADPTGSLKEGQVCIIRCGTWFFLRPGEGGGLIADAASSSTGTVGGGASLPPQKVLVYKAPGCHPGDIRKLDNV